MNQDLEKQLLKQLKLINLWIKIFAVIIAITLLLVGYAVFKVVSFTHKTDQKIENFQQQTVQKLDIKKQACEGDGGLNSFVRDKTNACN